MQFVRELRDICKNDVAIVGGKGASLGDIIKAGMPVPPGFAILSTVFEGFLETTGVRDEINLVFNSADTRDVNTHELACKKIRLRILDTEIPPAVAEKIHAAFGNLNSTFVAVRSSATVEDSAHAAWAGQLESYLNTTQETLLENIKKCWASLYTPRAIRYAFEKHVDLRTISVAVVVQRMVASEKSGVAFSVHPVTQNRNRLVIEAVYGLGEALVSGQITPNGYVIEKSTKSLRIVEKNVQLQERELCRAAHGGNEWRAVLKEKGGRQVLSDEEILALAHVVVDIENYIHMPVDVEWAFERGVLYVVQCRPITTLVVVKNAGLV